MLIFFFNSKEVVSNFKCLCVLMWFNLLERFIVFWIDFILEDLEK